MKIRISRRLAQGFIFTACTIFASSTIADEDRVYSLGVVPQFEPLKLASIWTPISDAIFEQSGVRLELSGSSTIPEFEERFLAGDFDFAYMNPYHSIMARDAQGYVPILRDGSRSLFGILVVRNDDSALTVSDLEGSRIAFPAPNALGASLMMRANLDRIHKLDFEPVYAETHTSAYLNVLLGEARAAGGVMSTFRNAEPAIQDNLHVIYETARVAPHPLTAHPRVAHEIVDLVREAMLAIAQNDEGKALLSQIPMHEPVSSNEAEYQALREMELEQYLVLSAQ